MLQLGNGDETSADLEDEMMKLSRENLKLCEDITSALEGPSENEPDSLIGSLGILKALRQSSEKDTYSAPPARNALNNLKVSRNAKRKAGTDASSVMSADDRDSMVADSPAGPSPKVIISSSNRLKVHPVSRAGSAAPTRETSVKIEEGLDSGTEQLKESKARSFLIGAEVFYRSKKATHPRGSNNIGDDGEGILCGITNITGEGKSRRYEIKDIDEAEDGAVYRARIDQIVAIPSANEGLPDPQLRKMVLAMYPGTTTFYRAEVRGVKGKDVPSGHIKLKFEDEEEKDKESIVEKRMVLIDWPGK
jgi:SAGA-associated factor 29